MKNADEMGSNLIQIGSGIQKLIGGGDSQTHRQHGDRISLHLFFQNKESWLRIKNYLLFNCVWCVLYCLCRFVCCVLFECDVLFCVLCFV
jgi:hypothetical protein